MNTAAPAKRAGASQGKVEPILHFIDGRFVEAASGKTFQSINPADNGPITSVASGSAEDIARAVAAARRAFDEGPWPRLSAKDRSAALRRVADGIARRVEQIAQLETLDTGLPITQSRAQIARSADNFSFFADLVPHITGQSFPVGDSFLNYSIRKPVGVAGLITPWNVPLMQETWKVGPCLAAGNTCVLKPAEWSPLSANELARIIQDADIPPGAFNIVHGFGEEAGAPLVGHPGVQLISFTGETTTGKEIMRNGADTLKRFSLELGGKSPVVVFADCDFDRAVDAAVFGVFSLNGERCTAGSRILVERTLHDRFVEAVAARAAKVTVGDPFDERTEIGPLIHREHWQRVCSYLDVGQNEGAKLKAGGNAPSGLREGNFLEATVLADATPAMRVFKEEIFGPVVTVTPFDGEAEALRLANGVRYGLAAYLWTSNLALAHRFSRGLDAGLVYVNSHNVRDLRVPFGGMKDSGIGREGGAFSFEFYTEWQAIHVAIGNHHIPRFGA